MIFESFSNLLHRSIATQIYSGEAMAASLKLKGKTAGGEPGATQEALKGQARPSRPVQSKLLFFVSRRNSIDIFSCPETCSKCGSLTSQPICQACALLESLNLGKAKVELGSLAVKV